MSTREEGAGEVRARALFRHRIAAILVRVAITLIAFRVVLTCLATEGPPADAAHLMAPVWAAIGAALIAAACGALSLLLRRNRQLQAENRRLSAQAEELADRIFRLKDAAERARSLLEAQDDLIVRRDAKKRITYANDAFCALFGRSRTDILGARFEPEVLEQGAIAVAADTTRVHDQRLATVEGPRWIAWREAAVLVGDSAETQSVGRDITGRAETARTLAAARDQAEAASRAKSRFLAVVSHEIRTPLNGILGMTDLLLEANLTPEQTAYATAVKTSGSTLLSLIEEILDFSKIEAGRLDLEAREFDLPALVEEVVELLAPRAQSRDLQIASFVDDRVAERLLGDPARLRQVLLNLVGNAIKFTEAGGVSVIAEPGRRDGEVAVVVTDTGIGIAPEVQARIFLEFEQADTGSTRRFGGTGLGLAIAKRIVEGMGGRITLESKPGAGSTFRIEVALRPAVDPRTPAVETAELADRSILVVSPCGIEARLLARRLAQWGAAPTVVSDEAVAAARLGDQHWDAILVDHALGLCVAHRIARCADRVARRIVLIRPSDRHELAALREASFTGYLVKPIRAASLLARFSGAEPFDAAPASAAAPNHSAAPATSRLRVLVAEDNEINALLARALLVRLGHRPTVARNGAGAIDAWLEARRAGIPYEIVLLDLDMPDLDGTEVARRIRCLETELGAAPCTIVALTANALAEHREECLAAGMNDFLEKPLDRERLAAALAGKAAASRGPLAA